jgi:cytochrome c-type biogenesis protein CcmH/NrfG
MAEKSNLIKKESLFYALLLGLVIGFIAGVIVASYKIVSETTRQQTTGSNATASAPAQAQLDNQTKEAISNLEAEVTANPDSVEAWTRLGHLYYDTDQVKNAIKAYEKSLELQPGNADVWTDQGVMYRRDKQPQKAIESFERAYTLQADHAPSRLNKGIVLLYDLNKPEEAIETWEELLAINPQAKMNNDLSLQEAINKIKEQMKANNQ